MAGDNKLGEAHLLCNDRERSTVLRAHIFTLQSCLSSALSSIRAQAARSFLTMLGVVIGVAAVICVVSLVQGLSSTINQQFRGLGSSTLTLRSYTPLEDKLRGKVNRLRPADLEELQRLEGITNITPVVFASQGLSAEVRNGQHSASGLLLGTTNTYQDVRQLYPRIGRFLTTSDESTRRRVVVLGDQMRKDLKLSENPTNSFIQIGAEWFKVIGAMEARGEIFGQSQDNFLLMPYSTALAVNGTLVDPDMWITFTVKDLESVPDVKKKVTALIRRVHGIERDRKDDFVVESADALSNTFTEISNAVTYVLAAVVGIALLVAGIGIMNIMLVSVTERTREIGIAKALGAQRHVILLQFLMEALLLAGIGGLIGIALGLSLSFVIAALLPGFPTPTVSLWTLLGSWTFSVSVGLVFGILPASNAANLMPIDALRHE